MRRVLLLLRKSAWFLLLASVLALFSGFMLGVNLFDYNTAYFINTVVAPLLFVALLYLHSVAAIIFLLKRARRLDNEGFRITANSAWTAVFTVFIALYLLQIMPGSLTAPAPLPQTTSQAITQTTSFLDTGVAAGSTTTQTHTSSVQPQPLSTEQIRQIILQRFPDAQILKIKLEKNGSYEAKILVNAQTYELKITSAGEIVKIETELKHLHCHLVLNTFVVFGLVFV
jgi:uncharacterized membrane protein